MTTPKTPETNGDQTPHDGKHTHAWFLEPGANASSQIISEDGLNNIASHKYKSGHYTYLDTFFNPAWTFLTGLLPLWMAPNMVTTLGGIHCGISYATVWWYSYNFDSSVPDWVIVLSAYCTFAYYTLDCMDGKQSRRTGTSSPLGQLFDHGFDCICNLSHLSNVAALSLVGQTPNWYFLVQGSLQYAFFMAQWEEYYTEVLPHAVGKFIGVTEVNYGIALITFANAFIDRETFWSTPLEWFLPGQISEAILGSETPVHGVLQHIISMEVRHVAFSLWAFMLVCLVSSSFYRVLKHVRSFKGGLSAVSKLISPTLLAVSPYIIPPHLRSLHIRKISVAVGLMFSLLTKKMIVFSMAKQTFACLQPHVMPYLIVCACLRFSDEFAEVGARMSLRLFCLYHAYKLLSWCEIVIQQICDKLDIYCFTIKKKKTA
eukprot:CAMPEP_0195523504 /NCGR_PEP_ID=MMETSP0794_2-20130614/22766_1 /TAXON_ID=515487 /ORGANISM="Stephanopyxis turris, Strain CCMP 815" /LENGTH=429 /DNA_ID=CAMNT_0040653519 /DNA_START=34 /DNA_END=1323 /DNA_ORIENTATION=-